MTPASQVNPIRARRREHKKEQLVHDFLHFLLRRPERSCPQRLAANSDPQVQQLQARLEEHYVDEQGKPAMYQRFESACTTMPARS